MPWTVVAQQSVPAWQFDVRTQLSRAQRCAIVTHLCVRVAASRFL